MQLQKIDRMEISFQAIKNLQIAKSREVKKCTGFYPSVRGEIKSGELAVREYKLRMDLINDSFGNDYEEFLKIMNKAGKGLNVSYFRNPNKIELYVAKKNVLDDDIFKDNSFSILKINGENINLTNRKGLCLYTYLAKLTRELKEKFDLSDEQIKIVNSINQLIQLEAEKFIDIM